MKVKLIIYLVLIMIITSCKNTRKSEAEKIVAEWMNKTITFPSDVNCTSLGKDTICPDIAPTPYRILAYTDSTGCSSCKLKLAEWKELMQESDSIMPGKLSFIFYFHPKRIKDLEYIVKHDKFTYPIYLDKENKINHLNNFPSKMEYQCFLLDSENKVISIGNPTLNPKIWELFKKVITENTGTLTDEHQELTEVEISHPEIEVEKLETNVTTNLEFILRNSGNVPLIIKKVNTSCGCTVASWENKPILPNDETIIKVEVKPDTPGYFQKTIYVLCNVRDKLIPLTIKGTAR